MRAKLKTDFIAQDGATDWISKDDLLVHRTEPNRIGILVHWRYKMFLIFVRDAHGNQLLRSWARPMVPPSSTMFSVPNALIATETANAAASALLVPRDRDHEHKRDRKDISERNGSES